MGSTYGRKTPQLAAMREAPFVAQIARSRLE